MWTFREAPQLWALGQLWHHCAGIGRVHSSVRSVWCGLARKLGLAAAMHRALWLLELGCRCACYRSKSGTSTRVEVWVVGVQISSSYWSGTWVGPDWWQFLSLGSKILAPFACVGTGSAAASLFWGHNRNRCFFLVKTISIVHCRTDNRGCSEQC